MYTQWDIHGNQFLVRKAIVDHLYDEATALKEEEKIPDPQQKTTKGWKLAVEWGDGSTWWENLADP